MVFQTSKQSTHSSNWSTQLSVLNLLKSVCILTQLAGLVGDLWRGNDEIRSVGFILKRHKRLSSVPPNSSPNIAVEEKSDINMISKVPYSYQARLVQSFSLIRESRAGQGKFWTFYHRTESSAPKRVKLIRSCFKDALLSPEEKGTTMVSVWEKQKELDPMVKVEAGTGS